MTTEMGTLGKRRDNENSKKPKFLWFYATEDGYGSQRRLDKGCVA